MGYKHTRADILEGALATAFDDGLSTLTFGRVANRLGISDRIVVYYFPSKDELVTQVLEALGNQLQQTLAPAFTRPAPDHLQLARRAWPVLAHRGADPILGLYFEARGLAAAGRRPYRAVVPRLVEVILVRAAELIEGPEDRRTEAASAVALLDGLLLLRHLAGPEQADRAARRLGLA